MSELLNEREATHGDFRRTAHTAQAIKTALENGDAWAWPDMLPVMREALHMIASKMARIVEGNPNEADHWRDIAGYAELALRVCTAPAHDPIRPRGEGSHASLSPVPPAFVVTCKATQT